MDRPCVALTGSPMDGYEVWGPFESTDAAAAWAEQRVPFIGFVTVMYLQSPEDHPVRVNPDIPA